MKNPLTIKHESLTKLSLKASVLSLLTVLIYYFSNNTAQIVLFEVLGASVSVAVLFFSFSFFLKDFIQKKMGTKFASYNTIFATVLVASLYIQSALVAGGHDFSFFWVLIVSTTSAIITETIDSLVFRKIFKNDTSKGGRGALISNLISVPLDTIIFSFFALHLVFQMPTSLVISLAFGQIILKYTLSGLLTPIIAKVKAGDVWKNEQA